MFGFIYITTNLINQKQYIGQRKIKGDITDDLYLGSGKLISYAIEKYGRENFTRVILDYASSREELDYLEWYYIETNHATKSPFFYNIAEGGRGGNKFAGWSEERMEEFKKSRSERYRGKGNPMYGKTFSPEHRKAISDKRRREEIQAIYKTDEYRNKISEITKGEKNGMYGRKHTEEAKRKMSENKKGKKIGRDNGNFGNKGDKAKNGKPVYRYLDKEKTILIKKYNTVRMVLEELGLKGHVSLMKAIKTGEKYKDSYWGR